MTRGGEESDAAEAGLPYEEDSNQKIASIFLLAITCFGVVANAFIAYLFCRYEKLRQHPSNLLVLALCVGDGLMCIPRLIEVPIELACRGFPAWYHPLCQLFGAMTYTSSYISGYTLSAVSMERYFSIVRSVTFTRRKCFFIAVGIWCIAISAAVVLPLLTAFGKGTPHSPYILQSSGMYCLINWGDDSAAGRAQTIVAIFSLATCVGTIVGGYFLIWRHVQTVTRGVSSFNDAHGLSTMPTSEPLSAEKSKAPSRQTVRGTMSTLERALMWKGIVMSVVFIVNWMPYTCMILYEALLARHDVPQAFETVSWIGSVLNSALNPILFIALDTRVLSCASQAIGLSASPTESQPGSAVTSGVASGCSGGGYMTIGNKNQALSQPQQQQQHRGLRRVSMAADAQMDDTGYTPPAAVVIVRHRVLSETNLNAERDNNDNV
ncbi:hypothetical protein HDU87_003685 [Geranomyces variabilis]|uniref:G-protein coupled receptors family 1 profile domain-containing protein n=1 Tax=Geranomyces variabilis TaxID=109894 RepID=A0AAD5TLS2_9FUNG|nr:hypothetical protein HDU87_003685 [Geranomyces variabilis]